MSIPFCLEIIGFQNFCLAIVVLRLALFTNQHKKSIEKHKLLKLIAPKRVKIEMPSNKKSLNLGAFPDTSFSFLIETNIITFLGLFTNNKQRYK